MSTYLCVYLISFMLAILTTPVVIQLAGRIGAVDRPGIRTVHKQPILRLGGVAILASAMSSIIAIVILDDSIGYAFRTVRVQLTCLFVSVLLIFAIGLADDLVRSYNLCKAVLWHQSKLRTSSRAIYVGCPVH